MPINNTDEEWERFGNLDPYFGVYTDQQFLTENIDETSRQAFFESGEIYINHVIIKLTGLYQIELPLRSALDIGCGVGRLTIPLAKHFASVTGIDISESMLVEAKKNSASKSIENISYLKSDDRLSLANDEYDLIHSFIVFQHIPVRRGTKMFQYLIEKLSDGGICVVHFTYAKTGKRKKLVPFLKTYVPFAKSFFNIRNGRPLNYPFMQMNDYDLNSIFQAIQNVGVTELHVEFTDHGGALGVTIYFRKYLSPS